MGLKNYFMSSKSTADPHTQPTEKLEQSVTPTGAPPTYSVRDSYANASSSASLAPSAHAGNVVDGIRREVLVNYLFQQQCTSRWIGNGVGDYEGVMVRQMKNDFLFCPPDLHDSVFGRCCMALNLPCAMVSSRNHEGVEVEDSHNLARSASARENVLTFTLFVDRQQQGHQNFPGMVPQCCGCAP